MTAADSVLLHFTRSLDALDSILKNGLLFIHNETGVLGPAANAAFGIEDADVQSSGMVCFTEMHRRETYEHRLKYGQFGIGVSREWLIGQGAQKVTYVEPGGAAYWSYVNRLADLAPKEISGRSVADGLADPQTRFSTARSLTKPRMAAAAGVSSAYVDLLLEMEMTQTSRDVAEREWRLRNASSYSFNGRLARKEAINLLLAYVRDPYVHKEISSGFLAYTLDTRHILYCTGASSITRRVPISELRLIFSDADHKRSIERALIAAGVKRVRVIGPTGMPPKHSA